MLGGIRHCCLQLYLLGAKQRSCEAPIVIGGIIIILLPSWVSKPAPISAWSKVVKFGTLIGDSPLVQFTKCHVSYLGTLAPPMGQSWTCVYTRNIWTACPIVKNEVPMDSLDQAEFNAHHGVNYRLYRISAISGFIKTLWKPTPPTIFVKSSSKLPEIIFRPSVTKVIENNFDPHNRLFGTANQIQQKSRQTGSEVIYQQIFEISTPTLVWWLGTLLWGCPHNLVSCDHWAWPQEAKMCFGQ